MAKIERKYMAHFINAAKEGQAVYERLGQDLEEFSPEMSAQVETKKNILGESSVLISGYEKTAAVEPFYADQAGAYPAVKETVFIEVTSYGGDTTGYQIPFTIHYTGEKVKGTFNVSTRTFTAA